MIYHQIKLIKELDNDPKICAYENTCYIRGMITYDLKLITVCVEYSL